MHIDALTAGETAQARITSCPHDSYWYKDMVGATYTVMKTVGGDLLVLPESHSGTKYYIRPEDCEIVSDQP